VKGGLLVAIRVVLLTVLCAGVSGCVTSAGNPGNPSLQAEYHIAPPDVLEITVRPEPLITRELTVRPDGRISMDLIGDVDARGRTVDELRLEIASRLKEYIVQPDVTVQLKTSASRTYFIFGEVARPGAYPIIGDVTAVHALGTAGGETRMAKLDGARLVRPSPEGELTYPIYFSAITEHGYGATNYLLQPGDVVYVPPNAFAKVGYALGVLFFPLQQILGLGGTVINAAVTGGGV
jgi:polysaccharide export outer membrane protein